MSPLQKLRAEDSGRHIWGCVLRTHPHICRPAPSFRSFFSEFIDLTRLQEVRAFLKSERLSLRGGLYQSNPQIWQGVNRHQDVSRPVPRCDLLPGRTGRPIGDPVSALGLGRRSGKRVGTAAAVYIGLEAEAVVAHICRDLGSFVADAPQADDISLICNSCPTFRNTSKTRGR